MFWKLTFRQPSAIDSLLDKEDCTLNEILDEDDVLQECKTKNKKLLDFLTRPDIMEQLVKLVSEEPSDDTDEKAKYKYPHIACELLTADVFSIVEQLSTSDDLLAKLWSFLDAKPPLNPLLGSFISKVLSVLLSQRTSVVLEYIQKRSGFLDSFLSHLGTSALMDLLLQMVSSPDGDQQTERSDLSQWLRDEGIVEKLVQYISSSATQEQCVNASQALCEMLRIAREPSQVSISGSSPLLCALESEETLQHLTENMFSSDDPQDWVIINGIYFLLTFLERRPAGTYTPTLNQTFSSQQDEPTSADHQQAVDRIVSVVSPQLEKFHDLLLRKPKVDVMLSTAGVLDPALGFMRLQVVRMFSAFLHTGDARVHRQVIMMKTLKVLLDLFFEFPWNNFLHMQVEQCISASLLSSTTVAVEVNCESGQAEQSNTLRHHLLSECQVVQRLLDGAKHNEQLMSQGKRRLGYMGHLTRMANNVAGIRSVGTLTRMKEESIQEPPPEINLTTELDEETLTRWQEFTAGPLAEMNKKNDTNLGGNRPLTSSFEDSDEEFDQLSVGPDSELEKAFQQYQDSKFANNLIEDFGLNDNLSMATVPFSSTYTDTTNITCSIDADEEHTQSMAGFEAACAERIQPFDDSESDEEESSTWVGKDIALTTPPDQHSLSSEEEEEEEEEGEGHSWRREFTTGSSDEDEGSLSDRRIKQPSGSGDGKRGDGDIGVISWRSEFSTDEDLSGVNRGTADGRGEWNKKPIASNSEEGWADFSTFSFGKQADSGQAVSTATPSKVTVTYVSVREDEDDDPSPVAPAKTAYSRLSSGGSDEDGVAIDHALIHMNLQDTHSSSDEEDTNSSDDEKLGNYSFTSEDGTQLLNSSGQPNTSGKSDQLSVESPLRPQSDSGSSNNSDERHSHTEVNERTHNASLPDGEVEELNDNYSFLSKQGMLSTARDLTDKRVEVARAAVAEAQRVYEKEAAASAAMSENSAHS